MRLTWLVVGLMFLGSLFSPWLLVFALAALVVAIVGTATGGRS